MRSEIPGDVRDRAIFLLLTLLGMRIGEVAQLRLEDVRWKEAKVVLRKRKAGKDLALPLHPAIARALSEYIEKVQPHGTPFREVFLTKNPIHPYRREHNISETLATRLRKLGLRIYPHRLRHTLASRLINHGSPPEWIQQLLGHADFRSTQIYAKVDLAHLREVASNNLEAL